MTVGIGILGFAHGHVNCYCAEWLAHPEMGVLPKYGWDHDNLRLGKAVADHKITAADSPESLLSREDIGAIVIASETSLHAELVEKAAVAGKMIILQKPICLSMVDADRIVSAVKLGNVPFTMAWQMRVDPQNLKIRKLLKDKILGRVFMIRRRHGLPVCLDESFASTWHVSPKWNRDIWADDSAHPTDFIYWLLGMPESVTAELASLHSPSMPNDNGISIFRYPDGPLAEICCSFTSRAGENTTEVVCERGTIIQNYGDVPSCNVPRPVDACGLKWFDCNENKWIFSEIRSPANHGERIAGLAAQLAEFIHGCRPPLATAEEGRDVLRMVLASYVSDMNGKRVKLYNKEIYDI